MEAEEWWQESGGTNESGGEMITPCKDSNVTTGVIYKGKHEKTMERRGRRGTQQAEGD